MPGSGTGSRKPRISPPPGTSAVDVQVRAAVLDRAEERRLGRGGRATVGGDEGRVVAREERHVEEMPVGARRDTPRKPTNVGVVVATPAVPVPGTAVAAWMCEAVVGAPAGRRM